MVCRRCHAGAWQRGKSPARPIAGFTLVELQVALVLVALIGAIAIGALRLASQSWGRVAEQREVAERHFLVIQALRRHLGDMRFLWVHTADGKRVSALWGDDSTVRFLAPFPSYDHPGTLYWWTLTSALDGDPDASGLRLHSQPFNRDEVLTLAPSGELLLPEDAGQVLPLAEDLTLLEVRYFAAGDRDGGWHSQWQGRDDSPLAIGLVLGVGDESGDMRRLPEVILSTRFSGIDDQPPAAAAPDNGGAN